MDIKNKIDGLLSKTKKIALENPEKAFNIADNALQLALKNGLPSEVGHALYHKAFCCRIMSDYTNGLNYAFEAHEILSRLNDTIGSSKSKNIIGIIYFYFGSYQEALIHYMTALDLVKRTNDKYLESAISNNIGELYREAKNYDLAKKYYSHGLNIATENNLTANAASIYINIGEIEFIEGNFDNSYELFLKSYNLSIESNDILSQGEAETKLGRALLAKKDYHLAREYFFSALTKFNKLKNKYYLIELLMEMAKFEEALNQSPINYLNEALHHSIDKKLDNKVSQMYKLMSEYYERKQNFVLSLEYYKSYHMKEKEIEASNLSKRLEILSIEIDRMNKDKENAEFKALTEKLKTDVETTNRVVIDLKNTNNLLMQENLIDELTQLYNRRGIDKMFDNILGDDKIVNGVIYLIDIDNFKLYNDYWGHVQGDVCLSLIATKLKKVSEKHNNYNSFVGRYGGEEFIAFFQINDYKEAINIAEELRTIIESHNVQYTNQMDSAIVTISIGGYFGHISKTYLKEHINLADSKLYIAKERGKNTVIVEKSQCS